MAGDTPKNARVRLLLATQDQVARLLEVPGLRLDKLSRNVFSGEIVVTFFVPDTEMAEIGLLMKAWRAP